jgi:hypothetical protein
MNQQLINTINTAINNTVSNYISIIAGKHGLDEHELLTLWDAVYTQPPLPKTKTNPNPEPESEYDSEPDSKPATKPKPIVSHGCPYVFTRGDKAGSCCGCKARNGIYCSKHKKYENDDAQSTSSKTSNASSKASNASSKKAPQNLKKVFVRHRFLNVMWNRETRLVIKGADERVIIGKVCESNTKVLDLTDEDIELCVKMNFKFDPTKKVKTPEVSDTEEEEEEEPSPPKTKTKSVPTKKVKTPEVSDTEEEEEEEPSPPKTKTKSVPTKKVKTPEVSDTEEEEEEEPSPPKTKTKSVPTKKVKTPEVSDTEEEEEEEKQDKNNINDTKTIKKSIHDSISGLNVNDKDVQKILKELQLSEDGLMPDTEDEEVLEEVEEEEEEEFLEEED